MEAGSSKEQSGNIELILKLNKEQPLGCSFYLIKPSG